MSIKAIIDAKAVIDILQTFTGNVKERSLFISYDSSNIELIEGMSANYIDFNFQHSWFDYKSSDKDFEERFRRSIENYREFRSSRHALLKKKISAVETSYFNSIDSSLAAYEATGDVLHFNFFIAALGAYKTWLFRTVNQIDLHIKRLIKRLCNSGIVVDFGKKIRSILRILFKSLDDENGVNNKISTLKSYLFYYITPNFYESTIYRNSY